MAYKMHNSAMCLTNAEFQMTANLFIRLTSVHSENGGRVLLKSQGPAYGTIIFYMDHDPFDFYDNW